MKVLLSIKPEFVLLKYLQVTKNLNIEKLYLQMNVDKVVVYSTKPEE